MKHKTIVPFVCRLTGFRYDFDDVFESDNVERINELQENGFLSSEEIKPTKKPKSPPKE